MQKVLAVLKHRWFIAGVALLVLALVIWFVGPLIGIGDSRPLETATARILVIVLIVATWVVIELIRLIRGNRAAAQLSSGIAATDAAGASGRSAEEVAALNERFQEAVGVLRKSASGRGQQSLYQLPWYIIIGPPGAGKTTALANSGLRFPLSERFGTEALRGVGGTRNCDWWFTDEAILLDTAGRYTTQDSQAADDRAAWEGFLDLLKKHRRRRPINGVLVAISASDLMTLNDQARFAHARAIKQRIQELDDHFGIRFPVYLLLTKCDLIAGFMEYFEDLGNDERAQVWGVTLPMPERKDQASDVLSFAGEFDALLGRLEARLLSRLHEERDPRRRSLIYGFPRQLASLKGTLTEFVTEIFSGSRFEQPPLLRGLYLTSGTQEGAPIDRLMGAMARTFGLDQHGAMPFTGRGRSYFITRLLRDVVFQESGLAGTNRKLERNMAWLQRGAYGAVGVLLIGLIAAWIVSYSRNSALVSDTSGDVTKAAELLGQLSWANRDPVAVLPSLDALAALTRRNDDAPFSAGFGLYQGKKLARQAEAAYRRVLVNQLLPRVMWRLEEQVDQADAKLDYTYEALKVYLMLGSEDHYDADAIGAWVGLDWEARLYPQLGEEKYKHLRGHLTELLAKRPVPLPMPLEAQLVQQARTKLDRVSLEERIYARLKSSKAGDDLPGFNVRDAAGPDAAVVFVRASGESLGSGLPGLFTREGYDKVFNSADSAETIKDLLAERWVLKDDASASVMDLAGLPDLVNKLRDLYLEEYAKDYETLIGDVQLAPFANPAEAARMLNVLSRPNDSPLVLLLEAVKRQTTFGAEAPAEGDKEDKAKKVEAAVETAKKYDRLRELLEAPTSAVTTKMGKAKRYANIVEQKFAPISDQIASGAIQHLQELLKELAAVMNNAANQQSGSALPEAAAQQAQATIQKVQLEAGAQTDPLLAGILKSASGGAANLVRGGVAQQIDTQWRAGPLGFCQRAIIGRYPFQARSTEEVRIEDYGRFFGYGGEVDRFFQTYSKDLIDTSHHPWRGRAAAGSLLRLTPQAIAMFERANSIKEAFFRGDLKPFVSFEMKPTEMDASITRFTLTIDGQAVEYAHGPIRSTILQWPGPGGGSGDVRFEMAPQVGTSMKSVTGIWAWFRVLDEAGLTPIGLEKFSLAFSLDGRTAHYELDARSAYNPFDLNEFRQFECVTNMSQ